MTMDGAGTNIAALMAEIGKAARAAARELGQVSTERKNKALTAAAAALRARAGEIKTANAVDMKAGHEKTLTPALLDRLAL
ncbi:MAG: gamma-glutamyl-phosphate reductase, partial [Rhodospirillaceae bacterium]|nr:gamma-glutamyl-phosphate reductase [Rhodospirillaceae bacterium]